jgi:GNAT superfamily N-acetyltransferase
MIGVARYYLDRSTMMAEAAITVHDEHQGGGLGTFLLQHLTRIARSRGVLGFTGQILPSNSSVLRIFHKLAGKLSSRIEDGVYKFSYRFESAASASGS